MNFSRRYRAFTLVELLVGLVIVAILGGLVFTGCKSRLKSADGLRVGVVTKLSKVGFIAKSWEGEIVSGFGTPAAAAHGGVFYFSVRSDSVAEDLNRAMMAQKPVALHYGTDLFSLTTETRFIVDRVTEVQPTPGK